MATTDDFSFPTTASIADSSSTAAAGFDSPPLWRLSPAPSPTHPQSSPPAAVHRRSFSHAAEYTTTNDESSNHGGEEMIKMDMLWEDFNEELSTATGTATARSKPRVYPVRGHRGLLLSPPHSDSRRGAGSVEVGCREGRRLRLSPKRCVSSGAVPSTVVGVGGGAVYGAGTPARMVSGGGGGGKQGLVVLMRVLKRLFLLHHHHHHHRHSSGGSRSPPVKVGMNRPRW